MKKTPLILLAALALASPASAAVLVGFYDFDAGTLASETQDAAASGFTATVTKNTESRTAGGSDDAFYGNSALASATGDGFLRVLAGSFTLTTTYSAGATSPYLLTSLFFDATQTTGTGDLSISYSLNGGPSVLLTPSPISLGSSTASDTETRPYGDYGADFSGVTLNPGNSLVLTFTVTNGSARMDNIALTGDVVPEPSSAFLAALGLVPFLRRRR